MFMNVLSPKLSGHKSGSAPNKGSGDDISDKVPVPYQERDCPQAKQNDEDGLGTGLKPNHHHRERRGQHHMPGRKTTLLASLEKMKHLGSRGLKKVRRI